MSEQQFLVSFSTQRVAVMGSIWHERQAVNLFAG